MDRALVGDLQELRALLRAEITLERDQPVDSVDLPLARLAFRAVGRVDLLVLELHADALERDALQVRVRPRRHGRERSEGRAQQIVGRQARIQASGLERLVRVDYVPAGEDLIGELAHASLAHEHRARRQSRRRLGRGDVARSPDGEHLARVERILAAQEEVVGRIERYVALRMFGGDEDPGRIVDAYDGVARRMHHHQRLAETLHRGADFLRPDIVEKLLLDPEITAGDTDLRVALRVDFLDRVLDQSQDVVRVEWRSDGRDRGRLADPRSRGEYRRAAEAVSDQERWSAVL